MFFLIQPYQKIDSLFSIVVKCFYELALGLYISVHIRRLTFEVTCAAIKLDRQAADVLGVKLTDRCTPGMGVNLWGASPLYVNPVNVFSKLTKVLVEGKGVSVRKGLKEARAQSYEPTDRNSI
jgi:hypothetical protein